jgi:HYR domain
MAKKDSRVKNSPFAGRSRRNRTVVAITLALMCIVGTSMFAQVTAQKKGKEAAGEVSVASFTPASPSKEMIYAGTRLITTEEPCSNVDSQLPVFINGCVPVAFAPPSQCPYPTSAQANYAIPGAADNCPGVTVTCIPAPGSTLPVGTTTTVTCTATDSSHNTATCSFSLTMFSACLVDDANSGNVVLFNATTGDLQFCCNGVVVATDRGTVTASGCNITIDSVKGDRHIRMTANNAGQGSGSAFVQHSGVTTCSISDLVMVGDSCTCH